MQSWKGTWRNQYGSTVRIDDDSNGVIRGVFRTVLQDSNFSGLEVAVHGMAHGDVIGFTSAARGKTGPAAVSYTGILRSRRRKKESPLKSLKSEPGAPSAPVSTRSSASADRHCV